MGLLEWFAQNLGLTVLTTVSVILTAYLVYVMSHPEKF